MSLEVVNPYDLSPIGSIPVDTWEVVDGYLAEAHALYRDRSSWMKPHERTAILHRAKEIMEERKVDALFADPQHPYSAALLAALPAQPDDGGDRR